MMTMRQLDFDMLGALIYRLGAHPNSDVARRREAVLFRIIKEITRRVDATETRVLH